MPPTSSPKKGPTKTSLNLLFCGYPAPDWSFFENITQNHSPKWDEYVRFWSLMTNELRPIVGSCRALLREFTSAKASGDNVVDGEHLEPGTPLRGWMLRWDKGNNKIYLSRVFDQMMHMHPELRPKYPGLPDYEDLEKNDDNTMKTGIVPTTILNGRTYYEPPGWLRTEMVWRLINRCIKDMNANPNLRKLSTESNTQLVINNFVPTAEKTNVNIPLSRKRPRVKLADQVLTITNPMDKDNEDVAAQVLLTSMVPGGHNSLENGSLPLSTAKLDLLWLAIEKNKRWARRSGDNAGWLSYTCLEDRKQYNIENDKILQWAIEKAYKEDEVDPKFVFDFIEGTPDEKISTTPPV